MNLSLPHMALFTLAFFFSASAACLENLMWTVGSQYKIEGEEISAISLVFFVHK